MSIGLSPAPALLSSHSVILPTQSTQLHRVSEDEAFVRICAKLREAGTRIPRGFRECRQALDIHARELDLVIV